MTTKRKHRPEFWKVRENGYVSRVTNIPMRSGVHNDKVAVQHGTQETMQTLQIKREFVKRFHPRTDCGSRGSREGREGRDGLDGAREGDDSFIFTKRVGLKIDFDEKTALVKEDGSYVHYRTAQRGNFGQCSSFQVPEKNMLAPTEKQFVCGQSMNVFCEVKCVGTGSLKHECGCLFYK